MFIVMQNILGPECLLIKYVLKCFAVLPTAQQAAIQYSMNMIVYRGLTQGAVFAPINYLHCVTP